MLSVPYLTASSTSGDSGFDSQGGCTYTTPWPNGKAPDYGYFSIFTKLFYGYFSSFTKLFYNFVRNTDGIDYGYF